MPDGHDDLCAIARQCMADGRLPPIAADIVYAGYGRGQKCALCGEPISHARVGYTVADRQRGALFFHIDCYRAWIKQSGAVAGRRQ
jgi:hypothetical protein